MTEGKKPNFLIIVADDLGFTDLSAFGGEIHTPNLKKLGDRGIRFTDFHTASACSPTRSMLFSGTDNHIAGLGQMAEFVNRHPQTFGGKPGYEGYLNERVAALPEILQDDGYFTFISGKWHLGLLPEYWPIKRGFEKSFTLLPGAGNHFKYIPRDENGEELKFSPWLYVEDDRKIDADKEFPEDFYSTDYYTDKGIEFITDPDIRKGRPFFGCLTYTAPHWPYQAPADRIAKYKGKYDDGPEELRKRRLEQALKAGIIPDGVEPHKMQSHRDRRWHELSDTERQVEARIMETYAAMVEILDENIGRVVTKLEETGELDNTFILFMSDNGAEGMLMEALPLTILRIRDVVKKYYNNALDNIGKKDSWVYYGDQWAQAATAPSYMYKMWASEGGIRCPLIIHYPPLHNDSKKQFISKTFTTVMDILPTVLELAQVEHPGTSYKGRTVVKPKGKSWVPYLQDKADEVHSEETVTGWELFGQQAIRKGPYKALYIPKPFGPAEWQLFHIRNDPGETRDLAKEEPEKLQIMLDHWAEYVAETGLIEFGSDFYDGETIEGEEDNVSYITCE
ncbi:hypothetical protein CLIB1423_15S01948 [[Candida] railenensis]|uniref:Sulfatase N-terminal domain-containing protein n=1 Tax=[Candida] railenensis TaxID=45579 RepID=A0A9P0QTX0_9ASCO|nr:hypothetical protein CLIB1423_15S01948 [[Candida] railenensis]